MLTRKQLMDPTYSPKVEQSGNNTLFQRRNFEWVEPGTLDSDIESGKHELSFVSETGRARPRGISRQIIRSQARRKRKIPISTSSILPIGAESSDSYKENGILSLKNRKKPLKPDDPLTTEHTPSYGNEIGTIDPFDSLPVPGHARAYSLLAHFDKVVRHGRGIPGARESWLSFAITDPAVLSAILFISSLDLAGLCGHPVNPGVFYWKGETIRVINKRLNEPDHVATDGTIAAVACLSHLENLVGSAESAKIHANALDIMIKSRGGLQNLGGDGMPRQITSWADITMSIILETKPRYQTMPTTENATFEWGPYSSMALLYETKLVNFTSSEELSEEMMSIYWNLRNLTFLKEAHAFLLNEGDVIGNIPYTDTVDRLERRVVPLTQLESLRKSTPQLSIFMLFGYATLAHMYLFMRDCSKDLPFSHMLSSRIRVVLEAVGLSIFKDEFPEMTLWIFIMGGLSGSPLSEQAWFAHHVAEFCHELGLFGGNQIAAMLDDFLWSDLYRSPVTRRFWEVVAKAQGFKEGYEVRRLPDYVSVTWFNAPPDIGG